MVGHAGRGSGCAHGHSGFQQWSIFRLPTLVLQLNTDFPTIQWVVLAYVLVVTSLLLSVARLGDIFGMKRLYLGGFVIFTIGSLCCGLAPGVEWLIGFRALQGAGAVMMQALGVAIITQIFPAHERGQAMGVIGSVVSVGLALGPALGGMIIVHGGLALGVSGQCSGGHPGFCHRSQTPAFGRPQQHRPALRPGRSRNSLLHPGLLRAGHDPGPTPGLQHPPGALDC